MWAAGAAAKTGSIVLCLRPPELGIEPLLLVQQRLMGTLLDDGPAVKDEHHVAEPAGAHAVRDIDAGLALHQAAEAAVDLILADRIQGGGGLVEDRR